MSSWNDSGPYDDDDWCDAYGNEYMRVDDHTEIFESFKETAQDLFKDLLVAIHKGDKQIISEAMDELAEHLEVTI